MAPATNISGAKRANKACGEGAIGETSHEQIVELIVGQALAKLHLDLAEPSTDRVLELDGVAADGVQDASLTVGRGEILALVGLVGAGQSAIGRVVTGTIPAGAGSMRLAGRAFRPQSPRDAQERGVAYLPGDRVREGVLLKILGATRRQISRILLSEYALLGALGSLTGMVLSFGGAWLLLRVVFDRPFEPATAAALAIAAAMLVLTVSIGLLAGRDVFRETPMTALRQE